MTIEINTLSSQACFINPDKVIRNIEFQIKQKQKYAQYLKQKEKEKQDMKRWIHL